MAFTKFASLENAEILGIKGSVERMRTATLSKFADFDDYKTEDGFLYARIRAISSRVNKNHDGWPSVELAGGEDAFNRLAGTRLANFTVEAEKEAKYGYSTFLGKPIFVDHHNSNPDRARGVIVDSKLHVDDHKTAAEKDSYYASAPDNHTPPTWVELLLEVDAKSFPKLAKAIIEGSKDSSKGIDGFSMGCDVEKSICNICKNSATTPDEYCKHIQMKGAEFPWINPKTGRKESKKSYEDCYGIKFFEISAVFDPADETALLREVRASKESAELEAAMCPQCGSADPNCKFCGGRELQLPYGDDGYRTPDQLQPGQFDDHSYFPQAMPSQGVPHLNKTAVDSLAKHCPKCKSHSTGTIDEKSAVCHNCGHTFDQPAVTPTDAVPVTAAADEPQSELIKAPQDVDTLRKETTCEICGSDMNDNECEVCGWVRPPEGMDTPDLDKAKDTDLKQEGGDISPPSDLASSEGTSNGLTTAHVTNEVNWQVTSAYSTPDKETPVVPNQGPATDQPAESTVSDQKQPVTSHVRTASDFIAAAGANDNRRNMDTRTADAASGAPAVATPDKNVDVVGTGGIMDASNEAASEADAQIDVVGQGGTGVEDVSADSTTSADQGDEHSKNIEQIPTKTFDKGNSAVERQADPVGGGNYPSEGGVTSAWTVTATDDSPYPTEDGGLGGGSANPGTQPADPVGVPDERVNVLDHVTSPDNNSGPTTTWSGTDGNGVTQQQEPVTDETLEKEDLVNLNPKGSNAHIFAAFKLADLEVDLGLISPDRKYPRVAELESKSPEQLMEALATTQRVRTAGLSKGKVARSLPKMARTTQEKEGSTEQSTPEGNDAQLFL